MCYLHFGNGVRNSRRNGTDYFNGVCTYRAFSKNNDTKIRFIPFQKSASSQKINDSVSNFKFLGQYFTKPEDDKYTVLTKRPSIYSVKQYVVATSRYCSHLLPSHSLDTTIFERESLHHHFCLFSYQLQTTN